MNKAIEQMISLKQPLSYRKEKTDRVVREIHGKQQVNNNEFRVLVQDKSLKTWSDISHR